MAKQQQRKQPRKSSPQYTHGKSGSGRNQRGQQSTRSGGGGRQSQQNNSQRQSQQRQQPQQRRQQNQQQEYDNTNRGVLFVNNNKKSDKSPNMTGSINIEGVEYWISAWTQYPRGGGDKFLVIKANPKDEQQHDDGYDPGD